MIDFSGITCISNNTNIFTLNFPIKTYFTLGESNQQYKLQIFRPYLIKRAVRTHYTLFIYNVKPEQKKKEMKVR